MDRVVGLGATTMNIASESGRTMGEYLQYGGQAVIEGVMMRSPHFFAVACRKPDGTIVVEQEPVSRSIVGRFQWLNKPFLRGSLALLDAMALGMKALAFAANVQAQAMPGISDGSGEPSGRGMPSNGAGTEVRSSSRINDIAIGATMVFAIFFGIGLFVALPTMLTQLFQRFVGIMPGVPAPHSQQVLLNIVDGVVRITIFLGYIAMISRMENIRRVFQYHGAEHKAINTLEAGLPLTMSNCLAASRIHPRCGTSFIIVVLIAGIVIHSLLPRPENYFVRTALHIGLIPIVAGVAYEVIRLAGKFRNASLVRFLLAPGLWSQNLTTREPDASQIEVALAALSAVIEREDARNATATSELTSAAVA